MSAPSKRLLACAALLVAAVVVATTLLGSGKDYELHAEFATASGLVKGGRVQIAGRPVGRIQNIDLGTDGLAEVTLSFHDGPELPLRQGTRATIRAVGQAGLTNRFVDIAPGSPSGSPLPDGGVLPSSQTQSIVSLDAVLDAFGPKQRADLKRLVAYSADVYAGSGSRYVNDMLGKLDPSLAALTGVAQELATDQGAIGELVHQGSVAAHAVATHPTDLAHSVQATATGLRAIAREQRALASSLSQLPAVLRLGQSSLYDIGKTLTSLRPALESVPPVQQPLVGLLDRLNGTLPKAGLLIDELRAQMPALNSSLTGLRTIRAPGVAALRSLGAAAADLRPILRGVRVYAPDLILGTLATVYGSTSSEYDAMGHYLKANFVQSFQTLVQGPVAEALTNSPVPQLDVRTGLNRRCPGGNQPPAPDGSNPWIVADLCTPANDLPADVDK